MGSVGWIYPNHVIVYMLAAFAKFMKSFAAIITNLEIYIYCIDAVFIFRICKQFLVIISGSGITASFFPTGTPVLDRNKPPLPSAASTMA
jgi:hypothetical protein